MKGSGAFMQEHAGSTGRRRWWSWLWCNDHSDQRALISVAIGSAILGLVGIIIGGTEAAALGFAMGGGVGLAFDDELRSAQADQSKPVGWLIGGMVGGALLGGALSYLVASVGLDVFESSIIFFFSIVGGALIGSKLGPKIGELTR